MRLPGLKENMLFAVRGVADHRLRSFLTILGIIVGVATIIGMVSLIQGFNDQVLGSFQKFGSTLVQYQKMEPRFGDPSMAPEAQRTRRNLTLEDARAIKELCPSVGAVSPERYQWLTGKVRYGSHEANNPTIGGTNEEYPDANNSFISEGRFFTRSEVERSAPVAVLGMDLVESLFPHTDPIGRIISIEGRPFTVIGTLERKGAFLFHALDNVLFMPITTFDAFFPSVQKEWGLFIATVPRTPELMERAMEEGVEVLRHRRGVRFDQENDFAIRTPDVFINTYRQVTGGISVVLIFISAVGLVVGGVGVMNIMLVSVKERTREIGVRKAVGAMRHDIVQQFLTEAMTLTAIGGLAGVALGFAISVGVARFSPIPASTPWWAVVVGLVVSVSVGLFFGIYPAYKAARLDPIDSLRYE
ncbi:MAG TPA: ABC transporter permease [Candidatus Polarisedimenticolia bacterium]|jgi:putative ABC transport system permease protein